MSKTIIEFRQAISLKAQSAALVHGWRDKKKFKALVKKRQENTLYKITNMYEGYYIRLEQAVAGKVYEVSEADMRHLTAGGVVKETMPDEVLQAAEEDYAEFEKKYAYKGKTASTSDDVKEDTTKGKGKGKGKGEDAADPSA